MRAFWKGTKTRLNAMATNVMGTAPSPLVNDEQPWTIHDSNVALHQCLSKRNPPIPNEIILQILDDPSRWIRTGIMTARVQSNNEPIRVGNHLRNGGQQQILTTNPLTRPEVAHIRCIVFTYKSRDQGWSHDTRHHGTYEASWTWMEASLTRPAAGEDEENEDQLQIKEAKERVRYELGRNRHSGQKPEDYRHELDVDHEMLSQIEVGDSVVLWARAMFPAWENRVYRAKIEVWCMDDLSGVMNSTA